MATFIGVTNPLIDPSEMVSGTSAEVLFDIPETLGSASNIDAGRMYWRVGSYDGEVVLSIDDTDVSNIWTFNDPGTESTIKLTPAITEGIPEGTYLYDIILDDNSGGRHAIERGTVSIVGMVSTPGDPNGAWRVSSYDADRDRIDTNITDIAQLKSNCCTVVSDLEQTLINIGMTLQTAGSSTDTVIYTDGITGNWRAGDYVTIELDNGSVHSSSLLTVPDTVADTITLTSGLPSAASIGNYIRAGRDYATCLEDC